MPKRTIFSTDIDTWTTDKKPQSDLANSYSSGGQPPSLGDVRQRVVSEPSGSNQMYSIGQLPSVNDVCRREPSQSEASCNRYDGPDENEVQQQVMSELNDPRGAVNRSKDSTEYSCYGERTEDLLSRFSSQFSGIPPQPPPLKQVQRIGTSVIKVFKSGEIERFVNISAYSGYDELKQDIARSFGIEGQLEDHGWRLLYADHDEDMLLVGDDPWQEFADCVRYIKILSPQEVQTRLDRDFALKSALSQLEYQLGLQQ